MWRISCKIEFLNTRVHKPSSRRHSTLHQALLPGNRSGAHFQSAEESQMLFNGESVEEYVVLGTDAQTVTNLVHIGQNAVAIDGSISRCRGVEPCRGDGGGGGGGGGRGEMKKLSGILTYTISKLFMVVNTHKFWCRNYGTELADGV